MKKLNVLFIFLFVFKSIAQISTQPQVVDDNATTVKMVRTGDLDGDGDLDIAAAIFENIVWYRNIDGLGNFERVQELYVGDFQTPLSVVITDINGDGYLDLLATSFGQDNVFWYENMDGQGNFGLALLIANNLDGIIESIAADIDGDGDMDVITNAQNDSLLSWFENLDGEGAFGPQQIVANTMSNGRTVYAGDIDGDGDMDLVSSTTDNATIVWYENLDGLGNFSAPLMIAGIEASGVEEIYGVDIDGDNDLDIVAAYIFEEIVAWFENLDGLGNYGPRQVLTTNAGGPRSVYAADLDNDGDNDVLFAGANFEEGKVAWFENLDGFGSFGAMQIIETETAGTRSVYSADIDGDGDEDVLVGLRNDYNIHWYKNLTILSVEDNFIERNISIYPNPVQDVLNITTNNNSQINKVKVYDILGKLLLETKNIQQINVSHLASGVLFVKIKTNKGVLVKKVVKE